MWQGIFLPESTVSGDTYSSVQHPCAISHALTHVTLVVMPLFGHTKIQLTVGQPLQTECGSPNSMGIENSDIRNLPPEKQEVLPL